MGNEWYRNTVIDYAQQVAADEKILYGMPLVDMKHQCHSLKHDSSGGWILTQEGPDVNHRVIEVAIDAAVGSAVLDTHWAMEVGPGSH